MGMCSSCFKGTPDVLTPPAELRRQLQQEAAEKRRLENERRGLKNPEKFKRDQLRNNKRDEMEDQYQMQGQANPNLRWQT